MLCLARATRLLLIISTVSYTPVSYHIPVLDSVERLLVGDVIHEDEAHCATVVGRGDGAVTFLPCCVLETKTHKHLLYSVIKLRTYL